MSEAKKCDRCGKLYDPEDIVKAIKNMEEQNHEV